MEHLVEQVQRFQTLLSAGVAIVLAVSGYLRARREGRRRYTFDVLMRYSHSPELLKALDRLRTRAAGERELSVDGALEEDLAITMPHFSAIALAANKGLLDPDIIVQARYGSMRSIWTSYGPHLTAKSEQLQRPLLYADVEEFLQANEQDYQRYQQSRSRPALSTGRGGLSAPTGSRVA